MTLWPTEGKKKASEGPYLIVYIDLEATTYAASSGADTSTMGRGNDWAYVECIVQQQLHTYNCGALVLLAFFRTVSLLGFKECTNAGSHYFKVVLFKKWPRL